MATSAFSSGPSLMAVFGARGPVLLLPEVVTSAFYSGRGLTVVLGTGTPVFGLLKRDISAFCNGCISTAAQWSGQVRRLPEVVTSTFSSGRGLLAIPGA